MSATDPRPTTIAGAHRTCLDPACHGCLPVEMGVTLSGLRAADAVDTRVQQLTETLRSVLPYAGVGFMAMGDNEHSEYRKTMAKVRAVLAEVDASQEPAAVSGMTERKQW